MPTGQQKKSIVRQDMTLEGLENEYDVYIVIRNNSFGPPTVQFCIRNKTGEHYNGEEKYYTLYKVDTQGESKVMKNDIESIESLKSDTVTNPSKYKVYIRNSGMVYEDLFSELKIPTEHKIYQ